MLAIMGGAKGRATFDDLSRVPDGLNGELIDGELILSPRPASPHAWAASAMLSDLFGPFSRSSNGGGGPGGWWILHEPELHLSQDALIPDVAGWRRERMPTMPKIAAFELPPDWV